MKYPLYLILLFLLGACAPVYASHIVGGEITLKHTEDNRYELSLNVYYDRINTLFNVEGAEPITALHIFSKRDNSFLRRELLRLSESQDVMYQNTDCFQVSIETRLLTYQKNISLSPAVFNDPEGYYVVWERCCRNNVITNIEKPGDAGMVFYLEFPPVFKDGAPFINNSPEFPFPDGSLLCLDELNQLSFSASDADGDSLVYSLGTPWVGNSSPDTVGQYNPNTGFGYIRPIPQPYTPVTWEDGLVFDFRAEQPFLYDVSKKENETRLDSATGLLRVHPSALGLYVFNVQCDEYRDGLRIGRARRDFQLLVIECPVNTEPEVRAEYPDKEGNYLDYTPGDTVLVDVRPGEACFNFYVKDPDPGQMFSVQYVPQNFVLPSSLEAMMGVMQGNGASDSLLIPVCWPECLISEPDSNGIIRPFEMDVVISDNNCPNPALDTLHLSFIAEVENQSPTIRLYYPDASGNMQLYQEGAVPNFDVREGNACFQVVAQDVDNPENLGIVVLPPSELAPLVLPDSSTRITQGRTDSLVIEYCWPECLVSDLDNSGQPLSFTIATFARDNTCLEASWDTLHFAFTSEPVFNEPPTLRLSENSPLVRVGDMYTMEIILEDPDNDLLDLQILPQGFELDEWAMRVVQSGERGQIRAVLEWFPTCDVIEDQLVPVTLSLGVLGTDQSFCNSRLQVTDQIILNLEEQIFDDTNFKPYNVITPNGDQKNDVFYIDNNPESLEWPGENCDFQFRFIRIYNRWGNLVFRSDDPGFRWDGGGQPGGIYFYEIDYGARDYKGTITLQR